MERAGIPDCSICGGIINAKGQEPYRCTCPYKATRLPDKSEIAQKVDVIAQREAKGIWPHIVAPAQYDNPAKGWTDPSLPDFAKVFQVARDFGYSIGLHGSMKRDVDLMAIPWTEEAADPDVLVNHLCDALNAKRASGWEEKPHGRLAINIQPEGWYKLIDLSVMPRGGQ